MDKEQLIQEIETAFKGVELKDGIGIYEADEIYVGSSPKIIQKGNNKDRMWWKSWTEIADKYIASYSSVMELMDSQGIKWALPAYMIYIINHYKDGSLSVDTTIYTIEEGAQGHDKLDLYTVEQKRVVAKFLQHMLSIGEVWVDVDSAQAALEKKWGAYL
ncbi:DUF6714 family protein [Sulfurovum sp.]|uniref:DUF6714 family protein n=1 Tax=Sulfurovum sp. TaxID=1969726 RepID=UPI002867BF8D|nr:DUF6714 family protein [Sulfurovum sp.]